MEHFENFKAWVDRLPAGIRWFFSFVLAIGIIGAAIFFTCFQRRGVDGTGKPSVPGKSDIDRKVDSGVDRVGGLVQDELPALERNRQAMEARAISLLEESDRLIAEARAGNSSAKTGK